MADRINESTPLDGIGVSTAKLPPLSVRYPRGPQQHETPAMPSSTVSRVLFTRCEPGVDKAEPFDGTTAS